MKRQKSEELNSVGLAAEVASSSSSETTLDAKIEMVRTCVEKLVVDIKNRLEG
jgi:hypothetical protein